MKRTRKVVLSLPESTGSASAWITFASSAERTRKQSPAELAAEATPLQFNGTNRHTDSRVGDTNPSDDGTTADYLAARIARDAPEVLERMKAGEFASVRAAASAAGLVKPRISISLPSCARPASASRR